MLRHSRELAEAVRDGTTEGLIQAKAAGELRPGGDRQSIIIAKDNAPRLSDYGITRDLSSRCQEFAKAEKEKEAESAHFFGHLDNCRDVVET